MQQYCICIFVTYICPMNINNSALNLLKHHALKKTPARLAVLSELLNHSYALSYSLLERLTKNTSDRITLYRVLKSFEEKGIIHKTIDHEGNYKYALCHDNCHEHAHADHHVHFNCTQCNHTYCMDDTTIPKINLPKGFKTMQIQYTVNGICKFC